MPETKPIKLRKVLKSVRGGRVIHAVRITLTYRSSPKPSLETGIGEEGYGLQVETDDAGTFTKESKSGFLQFDARGMNQSGLNEFVIFADKMIGSGLADTVWAMTDECRRAAPRIDPLVNPEATVPEKSAESV